MAKDQWLQVRSKNFKLIGNASEKDIRKVANKLEQFRETFRQVLGGSKVTSSIPTNVVVFKSDSAYKPFKPVRANGKIDTFVAGYFQPGEDVNYITLSTEGEDAETYSIIFHEYVHFIVDTNFGKSEVPPWFNEGLAEYYETFAIEDDQKVKLGLPQNRHLALLEQNKFIPLNELFKVSNFELLQQGNHSRNIFYAESWALIHYLLQSGKTENLGKFLTDMMKHVATEKAIRDAFQISSTEMETALRNYVMQRTYRYQIITFPKKLLFDTEMEVLPLAEAETNAYLGDLLYHTNRVDDAVAYLQTALTLRPDLSMANTTLGMIKLRQRKYEDAKSYLEKAIAQDQKNHLALFRYAYLLSREGRDEFGFVSSFSEAQTARMRELLKKAIVINPAFTESYELMSFIDLVNNELLDEGVSYLQTAMKYQPGNQRYALRMAEIFVRQSKFAEAGSVAEKIAATSDDPETKLHAENLMSDIRRRREAAEKYAKDREELDDGDGGPPSYGSVPTLTGGRPGGKAPTPGEIAKAHQEAALRSLNMAVAKPEAGEKQVIGNIQKVDCRRGIVYAIRSGTETFSLTSKDFQELKLRSFVPGGNKVQVGCGENIAAFLAVLTYKPLADGKSSIRGELVAVAFVPNDFRFIDLNVAQDPLPVVSDQEVTNPQSDEAARTQSRSAMLQVIKDAMRKPVVGERQQAGYIEKSECSAKGAFFYLRTAAGVVKLSSQEPQRLHIRAFTPEIENVQFGCGMKELDITVVFIYVEAPNAKSGTAGELVSLEFMPKSFVFDQ